MSYGVGFRFCENHARNACRVLENPLVDSTRRRR
nr:MAG TPA: Phenylalanine zipper [Caudoviricetes sp.]